MECFTPIFHHTAFFVSIGGGGGGVCILSFRREVLVTMFNRQSYCDESLFVSVE